jgi:NADH-quinone oxidoreductase subunit N
MASVVKVAMLFTFFKFFATVFASLYIFWSGLVYIAIILSLFIGYLAAIGQKQYKRLIAYSSITHSAFALFSLLSFNSQSITDLLIFTIGYGFSVIALVTISMATENENDEINYFKGISRTYPLIGILFIFALLSLTGIPPFTGFFGKSMLFYNAFLNYPLLVFFGLVSTAIGGYFYLNLIFTSYSAEPTSFSLKINPLYNLVLILCALSILFGWLIML